MISEAPRYLSEAVVKSCLTDQKIYEIVSDTLRALSLGQAVNGPKSGFRVNSHLYMGCVSGGGPSHSAAGVKLFSVADKNTSLGLPRVPATIVLCNAETGLLDGVLDATWLTAQRTAAAAIVAASACCRRPCRSAAVIGAGAIGQALVKFLTSMQSARRIAVASTCEESALRACRNIADITDVNVDFEATTNVRQAVQDADIVFTATGVDQDSDLVKAEWLKDGAIICSLGSKREVDLSVISNAWIIVDDVEGVMLRRGDFCEGGAGWNRIAGDLTQVMTNKIHAPSHMLTHIVLVGMGVLDIALGAEALHNARRLGLGVALDGGSA